MHIIEVSVSDLVRYSRIPIAFEVTRIFEPSLLLAGLGGIQFQERDVPVYTKDYDALGSPLSWLAEFDLHTWGIFLALEGENPVGGATVAWNTQGVNMLEGRIDLSVLWDIRVMPDQRGHGIGKLLFKHAASWSKSKGCRQMKIETQNINVNACRFYAAMGAELGDIRSFAYWTETSVSHEVQLNWYLAV